MGIPTRRLPPSHTSIDPKHHCKLKPRWSNVQETNRKLPLLLMPAKNDAASVKAGGAWSCSLVAKGLGVEVEIRAHTDSTAAISMCLQEGVGRVRHLAVAGL